MKLAALDVGSNTVLMLVVECNADGTPRVLEDLSRITRLARGVDATGRLEPEAAAGTLETIAEFADRARALGAETIVGVATAALRDASDGADFIARVKQRAGLALEIISGETEARLSYLSTLQGLGLEPGRDLLIVDIGGGSTELIRAEPGRPLQVVSLQIGSVRLTERTVHHDPPLAREAEDVRAAVATTLRRLSWSRRPAVLVGIAGTITTLCAIALNLSHYSPHLIHGQRLARAEVLRIIGLLGSLPLAERKNLPGMEVGRADVLFAGALILEQVMEYFGCTEVIVSDQGVRWGLIWREAQKLQLCR
jgi:exopolyphosphatase/guanosine-5'-triphosphate,3'-diphosphate pyrophosphatase